MTGFDLIVRLFALLLGFSIAEILGGFARTLRLKLDLTPVSPRVTRVGWLVPLLGLLVVMDQMSFWLSFYILDTHIPVGFATMLAVLFVVGGFYILSTLVFPAHPERWPDFDAHYFRVKRIVVGGLLAINLALLAFSVLLVETGETLTPLGRPSRLGDAASLAFVPLLAGLLVVGRPVGPTVLLLLCNAALLVEALSLSR